MARKFKNNAFSTLAADLTDVATTLTVATGQGDTFPAVTAPDYFTLTLVKVSGNEIVKVTARTAGADSMTIMRAQEGTTALAFSIGDVVSMRATAGILDELAVAGVAEAAAAAASATSAATSATTASTAKTAAEAARDAALIQSGVYVDEPTGRAAVADGVAFKVQGSGDVAAYEYRRVNASSSTLLATYPSIASHTALKEKQKLKADVTLGKNLYNDLDTDIVAGYYVTSYDGTLAANANYKASAFIPVTAGLSYSRSVASSGAVTQFAWFDSNRIYISGGATATATAPANAAYMRTSVYVSTSATFMLEQSSTVTRFVAYTPTLPPAQLRDGSLAELKYGPSSIGYRHTVFLSPEKNLFNAFDPDVVLGYYVEAGSGTLIANALYNTTGYVPVVAGSNYRLSYGNQLAWFDAGKNYISGLGGLGGISVTVTAPAGAVYLRTMVETSQWASFQIEAGSVSTEHAPFRLILSGPGGVEALAVPKDASVTPSKTTFLPIGKNKANINASDVLIGQYVTGGGAVFANPSYNVTGYIAVTAGTTYTLSYKHAIEWYNSAKAFISGSPSGDGNATQTAPVGAAYLRCTVGVASWTTFQVEEGSFATSFESFGYVIKDGTYPIRLVDTETDHLTIAAKQYVPSGKEIAVYHENIVRDHPTHRGRTKISFTGGKETGPSTKITPTSGQIGTTIAGTATVANESFAAKATAAFSILVSDPAKTTAANIQNIGDSYTGRMTWADVINASAGATGLTFSGNRTSAAATPAVRCEGQGGFTLGQYFTVDYLGILVPFMQPVTAGYLYYGQTAFWIDANSATPSYNAGSFTGTKDLFSPTTGRKLAPNVGDVMGDAGGYIQWDGSAWVAILSSAFGGFAFSYAKYRQAWGIPAPTILHVLLGTNDFAGATESTFAATYATYKANYDALIASVKADTAGVKIIVGIPVSSGRQGEFGTLDTEKRKRAYYLLAKALNADYGGREAENIYVLDYHSIVDRVHGYGTAYEKPFTDYTGTLADDLYTSDYTHLGADGFKQMGNAYMGLIQYLR